jgi:hypothetical protein
VSAQIGHTSVDDPDATVILHELQDTLSKDEYKEIRNDIYALRAPPDGTLLTTQHDHQCYQALIV